MKRSTDGLLMFTLLAIKVSVAGFGSVMAQTVTILHTFSGGSDGTGPIGGLIASSNTLYGTTQNSTRGIASFPGSTVFKVNVDGSGFVPLHTFTTADGSIAWPSGKLLLSGATLYGTAVYGGTWGSGTVFRVNTDGTSFTVLHDFPPGDSIINNDGLGPTGGLILSGNKLYGTASRGGSSGGGTIFNIDTNGSNFVVVHNFSRGSDGEGPTAGLILVSNTLYGTTEGFVGSGFGTVFKVNLDGTGFTTLHTFSATSGAYGGTNSDGAYPSGKLVLSGSALYGITFFGGRLGSGTIFKVNTNGGGFMTLHDFSIATNGPAARPNEMVLSGNTLYGFATDGGAGSGIFEVNTDGSGFAALYSFAPTTDGSASVLVSNTLYGTTSSGGSLGQGIVFSVSPIPVIAPRITGQPTGSTNIAGSTAMFSVTATGTAPLFYQWLKENATIARQTNSSLKLAGVSDADAGQYTVLVANSVGSVTSNPAILIVLDGPQITSQPLSRTNIAGSSASFTVVATGTGPLSYQWFKGTGMIPKQSASTLTLTNVSDADAASYSVVITNQVGKVNSAAAKLTVLNPPVITAQPVSRTNVVEATAFFTVVASGTPPLSYQWYKGLNLIPQQTSSTLTLINVSTSDAAQYSVMVSNTAGAVRSRSATLAVIDRPWIFLTTSASNRVLMWLTNFTGFTLQSTTNLGSAAWSTVSSTPAVVNEQYSVTNADSGSQMFFRLAK